MGSSPTLRTVYCPGGGIGRLATLRWWSLNWGEGSNPSSDTCFNAGVAELVDATDSKSVARKGVRVRVPPPVL